MSRARPWRVSTPMDRVTERVLVERLRQGDADAFDAVHAEFNRRLFTFLVRLSRRRDVAEDLLEETWLRFVKHARRLRADTRLGPWLFTVARNLHVSYHRSRTLEDSAAASLMALWPINPERSSPFEAAAASELERRIERALAAMSAASREVLLLVGVAGLDHSDAADVCGVTPEALRQRLHRARETLSKALERDAAGDAPALGGMSSCPSR
jgi:RNA polymerase sigma factor (sigma-70 family)